MNTITATPIAAKLSLVQSVLQNFCAQPKVAELYIDDLPGVIRALSQWLVAYDETPHSMCFYLRADNVGALYTQVCLNTDVWMTIEEKLDCQLRTSSMSLSYSAEVYKRDLYRGMLQEIKRLFGMNMSPYFNIDENPTIPFTIFA